MEGQPVGLWRSDPERRAFLARLEAELVSRRLEGLEWSYLPVRPAHRPEAGLGLVLTAPGAPGEVHVLAVSAREMGHDPRHRVVGALAYGPNYGYAAADLVYDPFPGPGVQQFELEVLEPAELHRTGHDSHEMVVAGSGPAAVVAYGRSPEPGPIADAIVRWRDYWRREPVLPPGPITNGDLAGLRTIARAKSALLDSADGQGIDELRQSGRIAEAWRATGLAADLDPDDCGDELASTSREVLRGDLRNLLPVHLLWHFPRLDDGRPRRDAKVLLAWYESTASGHGRRIWLVAAGPDSPLDGGRVTLRLERLIGENHAHRWSGARWRWDARAQEVPLSRRWGVDDLSIRSLGSAQHRRTDDASSGDDRLIRFADRLALCLRLQDEGRVAESIGLFGAEMAPEVERLVSGRPLGFGQEEITPLWVETIRKGLRACAPWLLGPALLREAGHPDGDIQQRRGDVPSLRLLWFPRQPYQVKAALTLAAPERDGRGPRLEIRWTGTNRILPEVAWRRPLDLDLLRFDLLDPTGYRFLG